MVTLELVAVGTDVARLRAVARSLGGAAFVDERPDAGGLPFRALVTAVTDDVDALLAAADVGAWVVCRRVMKPRRTAAGAAPTPAAATLPGVIALYPMVRHPTLSHAEADRYWRDRHAPLALRHHVGMSHYTQLSIVHRIHGPEWDGFALCGFDSLEDLRERFFDGPEGRVAIREDVARFADTARSPRRLIVVEESYGCEHRRSDVQGAGERAVVIGGSIAGLAAARVLADHCAQVVVLERDVIDDPFAVRASAPQASHAHGLLVAGERVLSRLFPGFTDDLRAGGARVGRVGRDLVSYMANGRSYNGASTSPSRATSASTSTARAGCCSRARCAGDSSASPAVEVRAGAVVGLETVTRGSRRCASRRLGNEATWRRTSCSTPPAAARALRAGCATWASPRPRRPRSAATSRTRRACSRATAASTSWAWWCLAGRRWSSAARSSSRSRTGAGWSRSAAASTRSRRATSTGSCASRVSCRIRSSTTCSPGASR